MTHSPASNRQSFILPSLFFWVVIVYEELYLKFFCFSGLTLSGLCFTLLLSLPFALLPGVICSGVSTNRGRILLPLFTALLSLWMGAQMIYYRLFKTFLTLFSLTKIVMVAKSFGGMAGDELLINRVPILMMFLPVAAAVLLRRRLLPGPPQCKTTRLRWALLALVTHLAAVGLILLFGSGVMSPRYVYLQAAAPELETQYFGMLTQTTLDLRRAVFGIRPDDPETQPPEETHHYSAQEYNVMEIDFTALTSQTNDAELLEAHRWFSQREPSNKNQWTGKFAGKNLVWVVAEGFSTAVLDPQRTPTLWKLSHEGFVFEHFYTPLWGVSTSDGEYAATTGLVPKSGVWSYSQSRDNHMPFALGNQFRKQGYRTMAFHDYLYDYYDRDLSHPNMGWEYYGLGHGLEEADIIPAEFLEAENRFPPSDRMMMDTAVPMFVNEDRFMIYFLTVSGHLRYNLEENTMSSLHWDEVKDLPYSQSVKCYLACQMELELAMESLVAQLEAAGKLEDTVIVLSADHYPYGLTDEEYGELLGRRPDPVFGIYENTLILWSAGMEEPVPVDKYCSGLDILPTLSNLFGLEYDSRLMAGTDILSDQPGLVIFSNYSFICAEGYYDSTADRFTRWDGQPPVHERVRQLVGEVQNRVAFSAAVLDLDYYRRVLPPAPDP